MPPNEPTLTLVVMCPPPPHPRKTHEEPAVLSSASTEPAAVLLGLPNEVSLVSGLEKGPTGAFPTDGGLPVPRVLCGPSLSVWLGCWWICHPKGPHHGGMNLS